MAKDTTTTDTTETTPVEEPIADIDEVLATDDLDVIYIPLPAPFKGGVKARPLTMLEMHQIRKAATRKVRNAKGVIEDVQDEILANKAMIRMSLVEPAITPEKLDALYHKRAGLVGTILREISKLNGITEDEAKEAVEEAEAEFQG